MAGLVFEIVWKSSIALLIVMALGKFFDQLFTFGESVWQSIIVLAFYGYCCISLFTRSKHKLFHVLAIPIFTQFLHLFQKYAFPAGANSLWRLMPFVILSAYFLHFFCLKPPQLNAAEKWFLALWNTFQTASLLISPNLENIALGGFLIFLLVLPSYFAYLKMASKAQDFRPQIEMYCFLLYLILGIGTFGLVFAGAIYKGSDNLLATRNITDTNVTMAYFILLWPFALLYAFGNAGNWIYRLCCFAIFISIVIFSFSRGAVILIFPYLLISAYIVRDKIRVWNLLIPAPIALLYIPDLSKLWTELDMGYFWTLRFSETSGVDSVFTKLQQTSGRAEIHDIAYQLFLEKPLLGHGTGSFEVIGPGYREAHSLFYTLLAEQGLVGVLATYGVYLYFILLLFQYTLIDRKYALLLISLSFYLLFNHSVGSVFVILPAKSVTINFIAPMLLLCIYFYANQAQNEQAET